MDDLISRQLVIKTLCERRCEYKPKGCPAGFCPASLAVDCIPSAQLIDPVKHGKWIFDPDGTDWGIPAWVCSECHCRNSMIPTYICGKGQRIKVEHPLRWEGSKFCPNCGLPMSEGDADGKT